MTAIINNQQVTAQQNEAIILNALNSFYADAFYVELNEAHTAYMIATAHQYGYVDWLDVITHSLQPNEYQQEAQALIDWYYSSWNEVEDFMQTATERVPIEDVITPFHYEAN